MESTGAGVAAIGVARGGEGGNSHPPKFSEKIRARGKSGKNSKIKGKFLEKSKKLGKNE